MYYTYYVGTYFISIILVYMLLYSYQILTKNSNQSYFYNNEILINNINYFN